VTDESDQSRPLDEGSIIFRLIPPGTKQPRPVAVADVPIFKGVYLRGWEIYRKEEGILVLPPYRIIRDEESGEPRVWTYLKFQRDEDFRQWIDKIRHEFERWEAAEDTCE